MEPIISVEHLKKSYHNIPAVKDISFQVESGKLFAFLGPNGAGKSTTINTICTFLQPDSGTILVNGYHLGTEDDQIRESIGIVFQENLLDGLLTVRENLSLRGSFYSMTKAERNASILNVAQAIGIQDILDRPYAKLSGGQRRRADIARALIHTPKILILDEPTTGLDPQTRKSVWETIRMLQVEHGMTIFLTTHYMEEAEDADNCIIIDHGEIIASGSPFMLKEQYAKDKLQIKYKQEDICMRYLSEQGIAFTKVSDLLEIPLECTMDALPILNHLQENIEGFVVIKGSMDDVFLHITGREIRE